MRGLWYRILILWYRLGGMTQAQAEWRARRKLEPKARAEKAAADPRFVCACGQLMVKGDRRCPQCGRGQLMPFWMRSLGRSLGVRDESTTPMATFAMLGTMALGYVAQIRFGDGGLSPSNGYEMIMLGASVPSLTLGDQPWRAVTYTMVHGGLMHIGFNAVALVQVGPIVEGRVGKSRFLAAWIFGGIGGALLADTLASVPIRPLVGASGSVFALIGMAGLQGHREGTSQGRQIRNTMIFWAVGSTVLGLSMPGISHAGHMGGLAVGLLIAWALPPADRSATRRRITPVIGISAVLVMVLSVAGFARWFAAGSPPPEDLPQSMQGALYLVTVKTRGAAVVYGDAGLQVLNRARRAEGLSEQDRMRILADANAVSADWRPVRRDLLRIEVMRALQRSAQPTVRPAPRSPAARELRQAGDAVPRSSPATEPTRKRASDATEIYVPVPDEPRGCQSTF